MHPTAVLGGEILEYDGSFTVTKVAALSHFAVAYQLLQRKQIGPALEEFKTAEKLNPEFILTHEILASLYAGMKQPAAATSEYQAALHIYQTGGSGGAAESGPPQDPLAHP
jgi:Tfp pilus assembly protein PilF